jgi:hypothetical protein
MARARFPRNGYALSLLLALNSSAALAQTPSPDSDGPQSQIWANVTAGTLRGPHWYVELDFEPKWQVTGEPWRNLDLSPLVEHYPADWLDLQAEGTLGNTLQRDGLDTIELTTRLGTRLHLFGKIARHRPDVAGLGERLPLTRLGVSTLVRVEWRNFWYSDDTPAKHQWRLRLRAEGKLALNRPKLSLDKTLYAIADAEWFLPLSDDIEERYVNKLRVRLGAGFRFSPRTKLELLYIRDWNRSAKDSEASEDVQAFDLRLKLRF